MDSSQLKNRTKKYSITILDLVEKLPNTISGRAVSNQIVRSGTSVGANYRAVCRARSDREFIAKMSIVIEESDETLFWLEIILEKEWLNKSQIDIIWKEGNELTAIFVSSMKTIKDRVNNSKI
ncbi:MAG: four helix bundle protein [Flavobacterium sp.]|nr:four helix bundle protein [Flavobacterium sp.]